MKAPCDVKGCDYVAEYPTKYVFAILGNHKRKQHGITGKSAKYRQAKWSAAKKSTPEVSEVEKPKRAARQTVGLNFCPCCGTNLRAVRVAIEL